MGQSEFSWLPGGALAGYGDERIRIAILDGPVDTSHPCFEGARLTRIDTVGGGAAFDPDSAAAGHGTHVASIILGQSGSPVEGIAPSCSGLIVPIFSGASDGLRCSQLDLARAIGIAIEHGAHIINISGGQLAPTGEAEPILARAIETCRRRNVLIVAAAGNDGCDCLHLPAAAPWVLAVGAMDGNGEPLAASNWGGLYASQGILAPGADIIGAVAGGGTAQRSGTSFATPFVSGFAGLLASLQLGAGRQPDPHAIRAALLRSAIPCQPASDGDCRKILSGRINIRATISALRGEYAMTTDAELHPHPSDALDQNQADNGLSPASFEPATATLQSEIHMSAAEMPAQAAGAPGPGLMAPSDCGCGCGGKGKAGDDHKCSCGGKCGGGGSEPQKPQLVYALGRLGYDFGSEARRDSLAQAMGANSPLDPGQWLAHLDTHPYDASSVIWTLNLDATPIYAVHPMGPYGAEAYDRLRDALRAQLEDGVELISVPGVISGSMRLQSGQVVPIIVPSIRGMYSWATKPLVAHVLGARPEAATAQAAYDNQSAGLTNFLDRVYYDLRNLGITGEERALNYSATNAIQIADVIRSTTRDRLDLDRLTVRKSPVCRPDSECYDVEVSFFDPSNTNVANRVYRFTVDVSDVIPVTVGAVRNWTRRV